MTCGLQEGPFASFKEKIRLHRPKRRKDKSGAKPDWKPGLTKA